MAVQWHSGFEVTLVLSLLSVHELLVALGAGEDDVDPDPGNGGSEFALCVNLTQLKLNEGSRNASIK